MSGESVEQNLGGGRGAGVAGPTLDGLVADALSLQAEPRRGPGSWSRFCGDMVPLCVQL